MDKTLYFKKVQELIGPTGLSALQQALSKSGSDFDILTSIDVLPRAFLSWFYQKLDRDGAVAGKMPGTEIIVNIKKSDDNTLTGFIQINKTKTDLDNHNINDLASVLIENAFDLQLTKNADAESVQTILNKMVEQFHFHNKSVEVLLKNDYCVCEECGEVISLKEIGTKVCYCYKALGAKHIHVMKKSDGTLKVNFDKHWDKDSIKMFVSAINKAKKT